MLLKIWIMYAVLRHWHNWLPGLGLDLGLWALDYKSAYWPYSAYMVLLVPKTAERTEKLGLVPQTWHKTLFDELKTSAYRCKRSVLWPSKYAKMRFRAELTMLPKPPSRLGRGHSSHTHPTRRLDLGALPPAFPTNLSRTAPGINCAAPMQLARCVYVIVDHK